MSQLLVAVVLAASAASEAAAVALPVVNPGFDATVVGPGFIYEDVAYFEGDPLPDHTFTFETVGGDANGFDAVPGDGVSTVGDSATGTMIPDAFVVTDGYELTPEGDVVIAGWVGSPGTGLVFDSRDYLTGQGPDGPGAVISYGDQLARGIFQTLTGTAFQPNTTYTFTAEVSDRRFGPSDNVAFPTGGDVVPTGIHLSLAGTLGGEQSTGLLTFSPPSPGGTSLASLVFTTGPTGTEGEPTGDITLVIRAQGHTAGPGIAATQVMFDNVALDATPAAPSDDDADFDGDGDVDGADFLTWQRGVGVGTTQAQGDANSSESVDGDDLAIWETEFGTPQALGAGTPVPEPASGWLVAAALAGIIATRGRRCRRKPMIQA